MNTNTLEILPASPVDIHGALLSLEAASMAFRRHPHAAFPDIYAIITRRVAEHVQHGGLFLEPRWISRLAGRFCERYLETLRWERQRQPQDTRAWAMAYLGTPTLEPTQHALLGLSAHINFDLAIGIHRTIVEGGRTDRATIARYKHDHDAVNGLLRASIPEALDTLAHRGCRLAALLQKTGPSLAKATIMPLLSFWRAKVWDNVLTLLHADVHDRPHVIARMDQYAFQMGRLLSMPLPQLRPVRVMASLPAV